MEESFAASTVSLRNNVKRQIDNPLIHLEFEQLDKRARNFARKVNCFAPDEDLFIKAARIAWDPPSWEKVDGLSGPEQQALKNEKELGFWKQPKSLRVAVITLCLSAVIQGWIQSGINGANLTWPLDFQLFPVKVHGNDDHCVEVTNNNYEQICVNNSARWSFAAVNAITYFAAALGGCFLSDPLQSWTFGRRDAILISACLCFISLIGAACSRSWQELLVWRVFAGLGMGAKASITPIFSAEISPSHLRGALVMNWQQFDTLGILGGFTANLIVYYIHGLGFGSWRWQIASGCLPTLCLIALIWTNPESPRWLLKKDRLPEAFASMCALKETPLQAAIELFYANAQVQLEAQLLPDDTEDEESKPASSHVEVAEGKEDADLYPFQERVKKIDYWVRVRQLFRDKRTRRATMAALVVMISQQLCGLNILSFYSSVIFRTPSKLGNTPEEIWMSWAVGLVNFLFTIPAYWLIDKYGRRFLLLLTYPCMALCMLGASLSFLIYENRVRYGLVGTFMFLFVISYSIGQGPVAFSYASEVFPLLNREAGMSFAVFANLFGAGILTLLVGQAQFPDSHALATNFALGQSRLLGIFVALNFIALILIFFFVPETAGAKRSKGTGKLMYMSLEELNWIFAVPTKGQISYQLRHMLPHASKMTKWKVKCWFRSARADDRPSRPEELYEWVERKDNNHADKSEADGDSKDGSTSNNGDKHGQDPPTNTLAPSLPPLDFPSDKETEQ